MIMTGDFHSIAHIKCVCKMDYIADIDILYAYQYWHIDI